MNRSKSATGIIALDVDRKIIEAEGTSVPADSTKGYAAGCAFWKLGGTPGQQLYLNDGTADACDFNPVLSGNRGQVNIPLHGGILAAGTPLAAWSDNASSNPGITLANSEAVGVRWNNNASQTPVWYQVAMPQDLDDTADIQVKGLVSKTGATDADDTTLTIAAFFQTAGALHDADADAGGASDAVVGTATAKTVTELTRAIAAADVPASPANLSLSVKPTDGTLGTDDFILHALWIEYQRKPATV